MWSTEALVIIGFVCFLIGSISTLFLTRRELTIAQYVALIYLSFWMVLVVYSKIDGSTLEIYIHASGIASLSTLLGIETTEIIGKVMKRK